MTMRLDIVTNDAGEFVRREHARELGAGVVIAVYRLAKLAQVHDLANQAFTRQLEQTHQIIGDYCLRSGTNVNALFAHKAVFVAGQLLKGSRGAYEAASELGDILERLGGSELFIQRDVTREELLAFAEQISIGFRSAPGTFRSPTPKIRLRPVSDSARLRGLELEDLSADERIIRTYASAVVIMRRFFEDLSSSRYILPRRIKRIAQSLVDLSEGSTPAFLGVTEVRNANFDEAGRAVNTAILAVSMVREVTHDRAILSQIAMAAMMHDVSRPRALALAAASGPAMPGMAGPSSLSEDQEDRLAAGSAAVLTALGRVNEPSIARTVLTFEALWLRRRTWLGPVYWGARPPTLHSTTIAVARRYNDLLTPEPGLPPPTPDYAVAQLAEELKEPQDRIVLRMLISALGLLPLGTVVQLSTGELAEVIRGSRGAGDKARVRILSDAGGARTQGIEVELAQDPRRTVVRVVSVDGWKKGLALAPSFDAPPDSYAQEQEEEPPPPAPPPRVRSAPPLSPLSAAPMPDARTQILSAPPVSSASGAPEHLANADQDSGEHTGDSMSNGSSPSAVAEAMGRMINDSLKPPTHALRDGDLGSTPSGTGVRGVTPSTRPGREATARGNLAATPLPHVLVYMLDHALTGSVVFEGGPGEDTIYFVEGVPTKIRLHEPVALLGQVLLEGGAIDPDTLEQAVDGAGHLGILLGEYLVGDDLVSREALAWAIETQLLQKIGHLANLPPEITYTYYREVDLLEGWGGVDFDVSAPLNGILASVRSWADRARIRATLNRIGKHPLVLHPEAALDGLSMQPEEQAVLDAIRAEPLQLAQLFARRIADEETISSLIYTLAVTRQFAFKGQKKGPMAVQARVKSVAPAAPAAPAPPTAPARAISVSPGPASVRPSAPVPAPAPAALPARSSAPVQAAPMPAPQVRSTGPAARPAPVGQAGRPIVAPQIRPIAKRPAASSPAPAAAPEPRRSAAAPPAARSVEPPPHVDDDPSDAMKTIALPAPNLRRGARGLPGLPGLPGFPSNRPAPGMPAPSTRPEAPAGAGPSRAPLPMPNQQSTAPTPNVPIAIGPAIAIGPPELAMPARPSGAEINDDGLADAEAALEAMTHFRLAEAALQRNDLKTALQLAQKAVDGDPLQADYCSLLAWVQSLGGNPASVEEAIGTMNDVLGDDPSNERALFYRGKLFVRTNRLREALADFTELLEVTPNHREAAAEVRALKAKLS